VERVEGGPAKKLAGAKGALEMESEKSKEKLHEF